MQNQKNDLYEVWTELGWDTEILDRITNGEKITKERQKPSVSLPAAEGSRYNR